MRLTLIGPIPPPIHGQSAVTHYLVSALAPHCDRLRIADTSQGDAVPWRRPFVKFGRAAGALWPNRGADAVYISVNAGQGMWLTAATARLARLAGARLFLHHHSYACVRERKLRLVALTRAAGPQAHHIVLSHSMANDLSAVMPEIRRLLVVGNAGVVDRSLLDLPLKADSHDLVLGHLSNLTVQKGIAEVVDLASALHRAGVRVRLVVGGPAVNRESSRHLVRAERELGKLFEYRGPVTGEAKRDFFQEITHFVFPSRYVNEAVPLVLYEAMAAGAVCVATRQGAIPEQLDGSPSIIARAAHSFVEETLPRLVDASVSTATSRESRQAFVRALDESEDQLRDVVSMITGGG